MRVAVLMLIGIGLIFGGCGETEQASSPQTVTVVERVVTVQTPQEKATPAAGTPPADDQSASPPPPNSRGKIRVPDVVGEDHQLAQDTMQAAGLYNLAEEDATGQGRMLLYDRNWTVVSQSPSAGSEVNEDQTITLRSKKDDE